MKVTIGNTAAGIIGLDGPDSARAMDIEVVRRTKTTTTIEGDSDALSSLAKNLEGYGGVSGLGTSERSACRKAAQRLRERLDRLPRRMRRPKP